LSVRGDFRRIQRKPLNGNDKVIGSINHTALDIQVGCFGRSHDPGGRSGQQIVQPAVTTFCLSCGKGERDPLEPACFAGTTGMIDNTNGGSRERS